MGIQNFIQLLQTSERSEDDPDTNDPQPFELSYIGYIVFVVSCCLIAFSLLLIVKHKNDDHFLYRSPNLVIVTFTAALICQIISGLSVSFHNPDYHL